MKTKAVGRSASRVQSERKRNLASNSIKFYEGLWEQATEEGAKLGISGAEFTNEAVEACITMIRDKTVPYNEARIPLFVRRARILGMELEKDVVVRAEPVGPDQARPAHAGKKGKGK